MPDIHIITYATHTYGYYNDLINNKYNINVITLGYGLKWNGLRDKPLAVLKYLENIPETDIVVFVDGFDSIINNNMNTIISKFHSLINDDKTKVILSKEQCYNKQSNLFYKLLFNYCQNKVYKHKNNVIVNSGLYMGYVKYVKQLLEHHMSNDNPNVDQILLNKIYSNYDFVKVDMNNVLFFNCPVYMDTNSDASFVQYPGVLSFQRIKRAVLQDYNHCFRSEIKIFLMLLFYLLYTYFKR